MTVVLEVARELSPTLGIDKSNLRKFMGKVRFSSLVELSLFNDVTEMA